jgi:hypothetical protein
MKIVCMTQLHLVSAGLQASTSTHQNSFKDQEEINNQDIMSLAFQVGLCIFNIFVVINAHEKEKKARYQDELNKEKNSH